MHFRFRISITVLVLAVGISLPGIAAADWVGGITFDHPSPSYLPNGEYVAVTIDCKVDDPAGARLYAIPYTNGSPTPGNSYSAGALPAGESTATRFFHIGSGQQTVDHVKISMRSADNFTQLLEMFVRVKYVYGPYGIFNIAFDEAAHSVLTKGQALTVTCDYASQGLENVLVFARPYADGALLPGFEAQDGDEGPPTGSASQYFSSMIDDADVDQVRITMMDLAESEVLFEVFQPVDYAWRDVGVTNITFSRPIPSMVHYEDNVDIQFDYDNPTPENVRIVFYPFEDGVFAPDGGFQGSQPVAPGSGASYRYITSLGTSHVNQVQLLVASEDWETEIVNRFIPVEYQFAPHVVTNVVVTPKPPALVGYGEIVTVDFNYRTDHTGDILIHAWPRTGGAGNPDGRTHGSSVYPSPSGVGDYEFFMVAGAAEPVFDQIQFVFYTYPEIGFLGDYWVDTMYLWGPSGSVMPVPNTVPNMLVQLGRNYPNPFNPVTTIPVTLSSSRHVRLAVYDLRGRLVRVIADEVMGAGRHDLPFDGTGLPSGAYHYRFEGAGNPQTGSMMLVK